MHKVFCALLLLGLTTSASQAAEPESRQAALITPTGTVFTEDHGRKGRRAITVDAGYDKVVVTGTTVILSGTSNAGSLYWHQVGGATVTLLQFSGQVRFVAPANNQTIVFELTATDGGNTGSDQVAITVRQPTEPQTLNPA